MYISHYVFFKMVFPEGGGSKPSDVKVKVFHSPQEEHRLVRTMRTNGYRTLRAPKDTWELVKAAGAEEI
jgi:hypothetical protein